MMTRLVWVLIVILSLLGAQFMGGEPGAADSICEAWITTYGTGFEMYVVYDDGAREGFALQGPMPGLRKWELVEGGCGP